MAKSQYSDQVTGNIILNYRYHNDQLVNRSRYATSITTNNNTAPSNDIKPSFSPQAIHQTGDLFIYLNSIGLTLGSNFTVSYWIYFKNPVTECGTTLRLHSGSNYIYLSPLAHNNYDTPNDKYSYTNEYYNGSNINRVDTAHGDGPDFNQWCHITLTSSNGKKRFFINGVLKGEATRSVTGTLDSLQFGIFQLYGGSIDVYLDDIVLINNQCLWETDFAVPTGYLINESHESQYTSNITGDVIADWRGFKNKIRNISPVQKKANFLRAKSPLMTLSIVDDSKYSPCCLKAEYHGNVDPSSVFLGIDRLPKLANIYTVSFWTKHSRFSVLYGGDAANNYCYAGLGIQSMDSNDNIIYEYNFKTECSNSSNVLRQLHFLEKSSLTYGNDAATVNVSSIEGIWTHYALVINNNSIKVYEDGNQIISHTTNNIISPTTAAYSNIYMAFHFDTSNYLDMYYQIDDLVVINGQALWTSNFDPPNYLITGDYAENSKRIKNSSIIWPFHGNSDYFDKAYLY